MVGFIPCFGIDATYKLVAGRQASGAILCDGGVFIPTTDDKGIEHQTFLALVYQYAQTECFETYEHLFQTFRDLPKKLLGMPGVTLKPRYGSLDRSTSIAKAFRSVWPATEG